MKVEVLTPSAVSAQEAAVSRQEDKTGFRRRLAVGAELLPAGGAHFRVWAPKSKSVGVQFNRSDSAAIAEAVRLEPEGDGYFSGAVAQAAVGARYRYQLDSGAFPDPASRFQPDGPHGPSELIDPSRFGWTDQGWKGLGDRPPVIYEMHVGTFTPDGTWAAAEAELAGLADLGITIIEVMPVAEFPGRFGWGYDGVDLFAPTRLYGRPDDFRHFVDRAHALGLGVILDVVYNHFGPDGNYLKHFSESYFAPHYRNEWGEAINFDGEQSGPVREFFCANATYWVEEFHLDGLRLDATQQIFDTSPENIQAMLGRCVRQAARGKATFVVAENEAQNPVLVRPVEGGGYGLDALWNDDFHHAARVALTGQADAYYSDYRGTPQELISAVKYGFLFQGQHSAWQGKARGAPALDLAPTQFVNYLQNHDQIANSLSGWRAQRLGSPGRVRALTALLLLGPATPMLFQGQEFGASTPFLFFADHTTELARFVAEGRKKFLSQFSSIANPESQAFLAQPHAPETFLRSKLDLGERAKHADWYAFHRDLLQLRREDPVFSRPRRGGVDGAVLAPEAFALRFFGLNQPDRLLLVNLGRELLFGPASEPLLAGVEGCSWQLVWSSESPRYGGSGTAPLQTERGWRLPAQAAVVFAAGKPVPLSARDGS